MIVLIKSQALEANARVESLREEGERPVLLQELLIPAENNALMSEMMICKRDRTTQSRARRNNAIWIQR